MSENKQLHWNISSIDHFCFDIHFLFLIPNFSSQPDDSELYDPIDSLQNPHEFQALINTRHTKKRKPYEEIDGMETKEMESEREQRMITKYRIDI